MKQKANKIIVIIMALVVFLTGTGATITKFCCDNCLERFFTNIGITNSDNESNTMASCCSHNVEDEVYPKVCEHHSNANSQECCKIERKSVILDSYHFKPIVFSQTYWLPISFASLFQKDLYVNLSAKLERVGESPPKIIEPRNYLSLIRILII